MEERLSSVKRGDWVSVEDGVAFDSCVVVVIGVTAVIRVPRNDGAGDTLRAGRDPLLHAAFRCDRDGRPAQARGARGPAQLRCHTVIADVSAGRVCVATAPAGAVCVR